MTRSHKNPYPSITSGNDLQEDFDPKRVLTRIESKLDKLRDQLWSRIEAAHNDLVKSGDNSIYTGYTGIALLYFNIGKKNGNKYFLEKAERICDVAVQNLKRKRFSFLNGDAGPLALGAVVSYENGKKEKSARLVEQLVGMTEKVFYDVTIPDEILYGRAGFLYALLFVNKHIDGKPVTHDTIRRVVESILNSGKLKAKQEPNVPLLYEWHEKKYLGAAHGISGILYMLLCARDAVSDAELTDLVRPTIEWLLTFRFQGNNFASSVESGTDRLVQWCHGAPGFVNLFLLAGKVFKDDRYTSVALQSGDVIWARGLLLKGYSLCHGIAGNGYSFMALYKYTKEEIHRYRLACFLDWCTHYPRDQEMKPDRPYSLFEGIAGLVHFLEESKLIDISEFPAYELE